MVAHSIHFIVPKQWPATTSDIFFILVEDMALAGHYNADQWNFENLVNKSEHYVDM